MTIDKVIAKIMAYFFGPPCIYTIPCNRCNAHSLRQLSFLYVLFRRNKRERVLLLEASYSQSLTKAKISSGCAPRIR